MRQETSKAIGTPAKKRSFSRRFKISCTAICNSFFLLSSPLIHANDMPLNMPIGVTEISEKVYNLHQLMFYFCLAIGVSVFAVMFYSIFKHRKSAGAKASQFHESTLVEIIWTIVPFLILIVMAIPATKVLIDMDDTSDAALTVKVTGHQWKWQYEYLEYEGDNTLKLDFYSNLSTPRNQIDAPLITSGLFPSGLAKGAEPVKDKGEYYLLEVDKPLVIPTGKKVRFLITSNDVIHSWWMPDFGIKKDAIPGFINELWTKVPEGKEATYRGKCTELCGKDHGFMPIEVKAVAPNEFAQWLTTAQKEQQAAADAAANSIDATFTMAELMELGEKEYLAKCSACHQANGEGLPPMFPALAGADIAKNPDKIAEHISIVQNGKNAMPAFDVNADPKAYAALITYERNAWGNNSGQLVQPKDVIKK